MVNRLDDYYHIDDPFARTAISFIMNSRDFTGGLTEAVYKTVARSDLICCGFYGY